MTVVMAVLVVTAVLVMMVNRIISGSSSSLLTFTVL